MFEKNVKTATQEVAEKFQNQEIIFLTESDLKTALCNSLRNIIHSDFSVNTESPWYDTINNDTYYIDITAYNKKKFQLTYLDEFSRKGYKYDDEALTIELKYFRYVSDIQSIIGDFHKTSLLIKSPKNECFIIAGARTTEIFNFAKTFMVNQFEHYRTEYNSRVKIFLFGPDELYEFQ